MADTHEFDAGGFMQSQGLQFTGAINPDAGLYKVKDSQGIEHQFDMNEAIRSQGGDPLSTKIANINTPDQALPDSPVSLTDRFKLATSSNKEGAISYLKKSFDDVTYDKDKNLVVKKNGAWRQVDPSFLDMDAYGATKEILKDIATKGPSLALDVGAQTAGMAAGGIAGLGAAQLAASGLKSSFGRLAGTYQPSSDAEQILDNGAEALLSMGGMKLAMGVAPVAKDVAKAVMGLGKNLAETEIGAAVSNTASRAGAAVNEKLVELYSSMSGVTPQSARQALSNAGAVASDVWKHSPESLADQSMNAGKQALEMVPAALPKAYREASKDLVESSAGKLGSTHIGELINESMSDMVNAGKLMPVMDKAGKVASYRLPTEAEVATLRYNGIPAPDVGAEAAKQLEPIIGKFNQWRNAYDKPVSGSQAATLLMGIRKDLNHVVEVEAGKAVTDTTKQLVTSFGNGFKQRLGQTFEKAGIADKYVATSKLYERYGETADMAKQLINRQADGGISTFVTHMMKDLKNSRYYQSPEGMGARMVELLGAPGQKLLDDMGQKYAAMEFSTLVPHKGLRGLMTGGTLAAPIPAAAKAVALIAQSPRMQLLSMQAAQGTKAGVSGAAKMAVDASFKAKDFVSTRTPEQLKKLATDPQALGILLNTIGMQTQIYDQTKTGLVQKVTGGQK